MHACTGQSHAVTGVGVDLLSTCVMAARTRMLSVGSGDASQQASIVQSGHNNIVTTFYDCKTELLRKYPCAAQHVEYLESQADGGVKYEIDATKLHTYNLGMFDLIFFTFPHSGVPNSSPDNVPSNQSLLRSFLDSAATMLNPNGEIQITLKTGQPYDQWRLPLLLQETCGLTLVDTRELDKSLFPGYVHRLTQGMDGPLKEVKDKSAKVFIFNSACTDDGTTQAPIDLTGKHVSVISLPLDPLTDEDAAMGAEAIVRSALGTRAGLNVLDIRREFDEALRPDTRQLNRILYNYKRQDGANLFERFEPPRTKGKDKRGSSKPLWRLPATGRGIVRCVIER